MPNTTQTDTEYRQSFTVYQTARDSDWWGRFGDRFGWKLHSFTRREFAHYFTRSRGLLRLTAEDKEDIEGGHQ